MTEEPVFDESFQDLVISRSNFDGKDVLEIGCGYGGFTFEYLTGANFLLGIDPDSEAIDYLKAQWADPLPDRSADFQVGNIVDFLLPRESFDIAIFSHSF